MSDRSDTSLCLGAGSKWTVVCPGGPVVCLGGPGRSVFLPFFPAAKLGAFVLWSILRATAMGATPTPPPASPWPEVDSRESRESSGSPILFMKRNEEPVCRDLVGSRDVQGPLFWIVRFKVVQFLSIPQKEAILCQRAATVIHSNCTAPWGLRVALSQVWSPLSGLLHLVLIPRNSDFASKSW